MRSSLLNRKLFNNTLYNRNGIIHLIILLCVFYIFFHAVKVILIIISDNPGAVAGQMWPYIGLGNFSEWIQKPWTLLSYSLVEEGILSMLTNLIWMYLFGSVVQTLIGYKEIIPLFFFSQIGIGILLILMSFVLPLPSGIYLKGSDLGILSFASAAFFIAPKYRYYISQHFSFPLWVAIIIFILLRLGLSNPPLVYYILYLMTIGLAWIYTNMVKRGVRIGQRVYKSLEKLNAKFDGDIKNPNPKNRLKVLKHNNTSDYKNKEETLNDILEKIHQKGIESLSKKEKETLEQISKEL